MKRWVVRICVFLLLGAIVNVAVAWGLWILPVQTGGQFRVLTPRASELAWWKANAPEGFVTAPSGYVDRMSFGRYTTDMDYTNMTPGVRQMNTAMRMRAGWPMYTLEGAIWSDSWARTLKRQYVYHPPHGWPMSQRGIPYRLLPNGFVINTLFYGVLLWLTFAASCTIRRWVRIKRGQCLMCGYDLRKQASDPSVCPECGANVAPSPRPSPSPTR